MKGYTFQRSNSFDYITDHFYPSYHKLSLWKLSPPLPVIFSYSMEQTVLKAFLLGSVVCDSGVNKKQADYVFSLSII